MTDPGLDPTPAPDPTPQPAPSSAPVWPPKPIDVVSRDDRTPAHLQHPKDHNDLQVAVNAILLVLGQQPFGESDTLTTELARLSGTLNAVISGGGGAGTGGPTSSDVTVDDINRLQAEIDDVQVTLDELRAAPAADPAVASQLVALQTGLQQLSAQLDNAQGALTTVESGASGTALGDRLASLQSAVNVLQTKSSATTTSGVQRFYGAGSPGVVIGARPSDEYVDTLTGDLYILQ